MKITKLDLNQLRNGEHFQFHTEFKELVQQFTAETLNIKTDFDQYLKLYAHEDEVLEKIRKSATTQQINEADSIRDMTYRGLVDVISAAQKHFNAEVRESARKVQILIDTFGNISRLPYNEETAKIYNLVQEMKNQYSSDITLLKLEDWVQELDKNNKNFEALINQRYDEQMDKTTTNAREIRSQIDPVYRNITEAIDVFARVTPKAEYEEFAKALNLRIDTYSLTLAQRAGRADAKKGDEGNSTEGENNIVK